MATIPAKYAAHLSESARNHVLDEMDVTTVTFRMTKGAVKVGYPESDDREYYYRGERIAYQPSNTYNKYRWDGRNYRTLNYVVALIDAENEA